MRPLVLVLILLLGTAAHAAGHRDAPATALDPAADVADVFAFRSFFTPEPRVTLIMTVHPFLEPGSGTLATPFDADVLYELAVDNDGDAVADVRFQFRFATELRSQNPAGLAGAGSGITAPANSPPPVPPGALLIPPQIRSFTDPGLGIRQSYTVTMVRGAKKKTTTLLGDGSPHFAVPGNLGPRTMDYNALFNAAVYDLGGGVRVFAGTTDDPFFADLGGLSDTLNLRAAVSGGVLSPAQDAALENFASDTLAGYAVNAIAIEVPVEMLTAFGAVEPPTSASATIGVWATTSRFATVKHPPPKKLPKKPKFRQVDRMGNPFVNDWLVALQSKNAFDLGAPANDATFGAFFADPAPARILNAATGGALTIPTPPRDDLAFLFGYAPPIAPAGNAVLGPTADLLRLNVGVAPTVDPGFQSRLGGLGGDAAGFPNGRRLFDDVTDVTLRVLAGVYAPGFNKSPNNALGDGVNVNDVPFRSTFPYLANAPSGRDRRHIDPGEAGCTAGAGAACPQ